MRERQREKDRLKAEETGSQSRPRPQKNDDGVVVETARFLTVKQAGARYQLSPSFFYARQQSGCQIPGVVKLGGRIRVDVAVFEEYLRVPEDLRGR